MCSNHKMKMMRLQPIVFLVILFLAFSSLDAMKPNNVANKSLPKAISTKIKQTLFQVHESYTSLKKRGSVALGGNTDMLNKRALSDCYELLQLTNSQLNTSLSTLVDPNAVQDVQALLSAASTNPHTCLDGLAQSKNKRSIVDDRSKDSLIKISKQIDDTLAMVAKLPSALKQPTSSSSENVYPMSDDGYPAWMSKDDRNDIMLEIEKIPMYDFVVAQDGSGNFKTINEALNAAPNRSNKRVVIYIKAGAYYEDLEVRKKNIMFVGDGMYKTWIKGNKNAVDGRPTFDTAVLAVVGEGFIAKDIAIENYAGPTKGQAVALRASGDQASFYHCSIIGYQDTLYVHSLRQFFRECDIYGTVDFIFGNSAAVFQKCNIYARKPLPFQKNVVTAQGRSNPSHTTGISIMESKIDASSDFIADKINIRSYLGRPWKEYSRTVIIKSYIGDLIDPAGWTEFRGLKGLNSLYYGEYLNMGPGADTGGRVTWPGFKVITDPNEAAQFTAGELIQGEEWLKKTEIPIYLGLPA